MIKRRGTGVQIPTLSTLSEVSLHFSLSFLANNYTLLQVRPRRNLPHPFQLIIH